MANRLVTHIGGLQLRNPVIMASGTFGYGVEYADLMDISRLGGISVKGISLQPRAGNPGPRICETPAGMLNSIGLANVGIARFVEEYMPRLRALGATVIANIYGTELEHFAELARRFSEVPDVAALELNISCPNVKAGGMHFGVSPESAAQVTDVVRKETALPVIVKLSPQAPDIVAVARAVEQAGADAVSLVNTFVGMAIDVESRKPRLGVGFGGLSGPAIRPLAVRLVYLVAQAVRIPVIGMGGITCGRDALEFLMAGATAVQVGTAAFSDPTAGLRVVEELDAWCAERDVDVASVVGTVQMPS